MIGLAMGAWTFVSGNWRLIAAGTALATLAAGALTLNNRAWDRGYATAKAEQSTIDREKTDAANRADDDARRCALDPDCRLRDDGYRRD